MEKAYVIAVTGKKARSNGFRISNEAFMFVAVSFNALVLLYHMTSNR